MLMAGDDVRLAFAHVLWIGGSPDAGKTSIARTLADRYGLRAYHFDRHELAHFGRLDPARHPALYTAHPDRMTSEQRWVEPSPEAMARATIASWMERFGMALDDLLALPATTPIVAEGPGFFPECVAPLIDDPCQAVWLVPSEAFKRDSVIRRGKPGTRHETSDPERATRNLIARDLLMGEHIRRRARELGLTVYTVDGTRDLDAMTALVEAHFAPRLPQRA
jgi:hypothetical protein